MQELHRVLNIPQYGYVLIYNNRQGSEYASYST